MGSLGTGLLWCRLTSVTVARAVLYKTCESEILVKSEQVKENAFENKFLNKSNFLSRNAPHKFNLTQREWLLKALVK